MGGTEKIPIEKFGRYEIVRELGKGAMGVVYLARDPLIGRLVALKTVRGPAQGEDDGDLHNFHERFLREAQAAGILSHPGIVTIHDAGNDEAEGTTFLAMEYIEGKTLKACLAEREPLLISDVVEIASQVAEALDYAHRKGIVHRDVKPANVIITTEGRVKIADFGIAKIASSSLTTTGRFLGTPKYMSPEQVTGSSVDGRSDLFSLGMVLYEMLTRRIPFTGDNMTTISYKIAHEEFALPSEVGPGVPEDFDRIVSRALAKEPWNRYQRGNEFAEDLRQVPQIADVLPLRRLSRGYVEVSAATLDSTPGSADDGGGLHTLPHAPTPPGGVEKPQSGVSMRPRSGTMPRPRSPTGDVRPGVSSPVAARWGGARITGFLRERRGKIVLGGMAALAVLLALVLIPAGSDDPGFFPVLLGKPRARRARSPSFPAFLRDSEEPAASTAAAPATASGSAENISAGSDAANAALHVIFSSSLPGGILRIESNHRALMSHSFTPSSQGLDKVLRLAPGELRLKVSLAAADGSFRGTQTVEGQFGPGQTRTLRVSLFKNHLLAILDE